ncbi:MAG: hypothetical protein Q9205_006387, partial [Flavoplaca limonia]
MFTCWVAQRAHLLTLILATTVVKHTNAVFISPAANLGQRPTDQDTSDSSAVAASGTDLLALRDQYGHVTCYGSVIIPPPGPESCAGAIKHIPDDDTPIRSFYDPTRFLQLPHLFSSSDGKCVLRVDAGAKKVEEVITGKRLRFFVTELLNKCVIAQKKDGLVNVEGRDQYFVVYFAMYDPSGIKCSDPSPAPAPSGCEGALDMMGSDLDIKTVRYTDDGKVKPWDIELPQTFLGPPGGEEPTCMIRLDVTGKEWLTPAKMWQAVVAVNAKLSNPSKATRPVMPRLLLPNQTLASLANLGRQIEQLVIKQRAPSIPAHNTTLNYDILAIVLEYIYHVSPKSFYALSLTSKELHRLAQRYLFRKLRFTFSRCWNHRNNALLQRLQNDAQARSYVQEIYVNWTAGANPRHDTIEGLHLVSLFIELIPQFTRLKRF